MLQRTLHYVLLAAISLFFLVPLLIMITTSLQDTQSLLSGGASIIPKTFEWSVYTEIFTGEVRNFQFFQSALNSIVVTLLSVAGVIVSSILVGYGFARFRFPFRETLFLMMLATMMVPFHVLMVPEYIMLSQWFGLGDTFVPLYIREWLGVPFFIFLARQFYKGIPIDTEESAIIDGCNSFQVLWHIMLPHLKPVIMTIGVLSFVGQWNEFLKALIYLHTPDKFTLPLSLSVLASSGQLGAGVPQDNYLMAASLLTMLPCIILFFVAQKYFMEGVDVSQGVKG